MDQPLLRKCFGVISGIIVRTLDALGFSQKSPVASARKIVHHSVPLDIGERTTRSQSSRLHASPNGVLLTVLFAVVTVYTGVRLTGTVLAGHRLVSAESALRKLRTELWESRRNAATHRLTDRIENARRFPGSAEEIEKILGQLRREFSSDPGGQALYDQFAFSWDRTNSLAEANMHAAAMQISALNVLRQSTVSASGFLQPAVVET